jgi:prolyl oligopeptidase PreP (S9A serine peptidase family)
MLLLAKINELKTERGGMFEVEQYGSLSKDPERYPLFVVKTRAWETSKPTILVTGGVHGWVVSSTDTLTS